MMIWWVKGDGCWVVSKVLSKVAVLVSLASRPAVVMLQQSSDWWSAGSDWPWVARGGERRDWRYNTILT